MIGRGRELAGLLLLLAAASARAGGRSTGLGERGRRGKRRDGDREVSSLPASARKYVTRLITAYVGDVPPAISKPLIARHKKQHCSTYVSYAGGTTDKLGTYLRIDGPQAWIEFAVQSTDKGSSHYHSVYRDKKHDYGA